LRFGIEDVDEAIKHLRRRSVDRFERDGRSTAGLRERIAAVTAAGATGQRRQQRQQHDGACNGICGGDIRWHATSL
jgi:hypothetical protein